MLICHLEGLVLILGGGGGCWGRGASQVDKWEVQDTDFAGNMEKNGVVVGWYWC